LSTLISIIYEWVGLWQNTFLKIYMFDIKYWKLKDNISKTSRDEYRVSTGQQLSRHYD
jgi:hypothetical protein